MVLSGILGGVLVSKVLAGFVTQSVGWRAPYWAASAAMLGLAALLALAAAAQPAGQPRCATANFIGSTLRLAREEPALRRHALYGGLTFASFMAFWSTYAIYLDEAFGYGPAIAGLFGLVGLAGSIAASVAGRQIDRGRFTLVCAGAAALMIAGFAVLIAGATSVAAIVVGVLLMDFGAGLSHAAAVDRLRPAPRRARPHQQRLYERLFPRRRGRHLAHDPRLRRRRLGPLTCTFGAACAALILALEFAAPVMGRSARPAPAQQNMTIGSQGNRNGIRREDRARHRGVQQHRRGHRQTARARRRDGRGPLWQQGGRCGRRSSPRSRRTAARPS